MRPPQKWNVWSWPPNYLPVQKIPTNLLSCCYYSYHEWLGQNSGHCRHVFITAYMQGGREIGQFWVWWGMTEAVPLLYAERWERRWSGRRCDAGGGGMLQIISLWKWKSGTDERLDFNCYIWLLIVHITNRGEKWCGCNLEMMWQMMCHSYMCREFT
jgi:hypothetical protein